VQRQMLPSIGWAGDCGYLSHGCHQHERGESVIKDYFTILWHLTTTIKDEPLAADAEPVGTKLVYPIDTLSTIQINADTL
jgi:hypothetical protein